MTPKLKRNLMIGAVGATLLGVAGGGAYAATKSSGSDPRQAFLDDVAGRLHVSAADLQAALKGAASDQVDAAVKAGKLTQAQADKIKQSIQQNGAPLGGPGKFFGGPPGGPGKFFGGPLGGVDRGGPFVEPFFGGIEAAAKYLGLTDAQLRKELGGDKSLADVAKAHNKSADGLKSAIKAAAKTQLDSAVSSKKLTQAQEDKILSDLDSRIGDLVNGKAVTAPRKFFRPRGGGGRPGHFAFPVLPGG